MSNRTCLLIDDDVDDHEIFKWAIDSLEEKISCISALNAPEALDQLHESAEHLPDYIFLDVNMPRMDGRECLSTIKSWPHLNHVPVFMYSTSWSVADTEEFISLGAQTLIQKPSKISELTSILKAVLIPGNNNL